MKKESLVILVEQSARVRGEASVPKEYILKALEKIELGEESVEKYPTGFPSLKGVSKIATKLFMAEKRN